MRGVTYSVLESGRAAENVVPGSTEERTSSLFDRLELGRRIDIGDVLLESLKVMVRSRFPMFELLYCLPDS